MAILILDNNNFKSAIEAHHMMVVDFWAPWCKPCTDFQPIFEKIATQHPEITFASLNTDDSPAIADYFNIKQVPCILAIKQQIVIDGLIGTLTHDALTQHLAMWKSFDLTEIHQHFAAKIS